MTALVPLALSDAVRDWLDLGLRWLHVIAAMAWIGTSFYFVLLDQSLRPPQDAGDADAGVGGELWEVHGGGFYHVQKYVVAPRVLPDHLAWFKWEAYTTWLSGFALMLVLYYLEASSALVKPGDDLDPWLAVAISIALLVVAWLVYDGLNRLVSDGRVLWPVLFALVALSAWGSAELFSPRAAWLQVGAMIGTVMAANVFFDIIPAHWELIRAKEAGREPDPAPAIQAKQRSVHNNYLTLPVVLTMLAGHFPFAYGADHAWLVLVALMAIGAWARLFFNLRHAGRTHWWMPAAGAAAFLLVAVVVERSDDGAAQPAAAADAARG
ncbi:MAG TPA: urate hydroxylase PuuD, partial [Gaiella sp.]|nr:urate hydroxylase PuuD [Gaiella sp.]